MNEKKTKNSPDWSESLRQVLDEQLSSMDAVPAPANVCYFKEMTFDHTELDNSRWKTLVENAIKNARCFEIHCWSAELEYIALARRFGQIKETNWKYGVVITGSVTREFKDWILQLPKPLDTEIYNKMTPFFNLFLDDNFQSCHYGTEVYYSEPKERGRRMMKKRLKGAEIVQKYDFWGYQVEINETATKDWYEKADAWGCDCGDCSNFLALAQRKELPAAVMAVLDSLGIPPQKATYVYELYPDGAGHYYQVSYRIAGDILSTTEAMAEPLSWGEGRCCHEPYPYGAPGFPEPHFDLEFLVTLPWALEENSNDKGKDLPTGGERSTL